MIFRGILILTFLTLAACAAPVGKRFKFNAETPKTLVVMGLRYEAMPVFNFREFDLETGEVLDRTEVVNISSDLTGERSAGDAIVFAVEPGHWFLSYYSTTAGMTTKITSLGAGTLAFKAAPGEVIYIGEYDLSRYGLRRLKPDLGKAHAKLADYKYVNAPVSFPLPMSVRYSCDEEARSIVGIKIARCVPLKVSVVQ